MSDNGLPVTQTEYLPFGETWFQEGNSANKAKFNSQELDEESGFYFYNARHYDPEIGRFVTADNVIPDVFNTQAWNRYSYVLNNPIRYSDPSGNEGEQSQTWSAKLGGLFGEIGAAAGSLIDNVVGTAKKVEKTASEVKQTVNTGLVNAKDKVVKISKKVAKTAEAVGEGAAEIAEDYSDLVHEAHDKENYLKNSGHASSFILRLFEGIIKDIGDESIAGDSDYSSELPSAANVYEKEADKWAGSFPVKLVMACWGSRVAYKHLQNRAKVRSLKNNSVSDIGERIYLSQIEADRLNAIHKVELYATRARNCDYKYMEWEMRKLSQMESGKRVLVEVNKIATQAARTAAPKEFKIFQTISKNAKFFSQIPKKE